jgi:hypothetical protein
MGISSFECHNKHLPGSRGKSFWEFATGAPEDFFLLIQKGSKIKRFIEIIYYRVKSVKYEEYR